VRAIRPLVRERSLLQWDPTGGEFQAESGPAAYPDNDAAVAEFTQCVDFYVRSPLAGRSGQSTSTSWK